MTDKIKVGLAISEMILHLFLPVRTLWFFIQKYLASMRQW